MRLQELFETTASRDSNIIVLDQDLATEFQEADIQLITSDSREAKSGSVFVALSGSHTDGHQYVKQAIEQGVSAVVIDRKKQSQFDDALLGKVPVFLADNTYLALGLMSAVFNNMPGEALRMVGVTGTNGKTTVTHLVEKMIADQNKKVGLIGTLGVKSAGNKIETGHTTPMAPELQEILSGFVKDGAEFAVMEVSSHALEQHRVAGCEFDVAVLTNLTQDHLDYHKTMEEYWRAKAKLFESLNPSTKPRYAVINLDSDYAEQFVTACSESVNFYTYGLNQFETPFEIEPPVIYPKDVTYSIEGASFTVVTPMGEAPVRLKIAGEFSVYNALAAIGSGLALGFPLKDCIASIESVPGIRGRFEVVAQSPYVIVDYAHTPDGLKNVLEAARPVVPEGGRLITVFGCGGDRDATKRPKMGHIVEELSDVLVVTSDNPRTEDPQQIITDVINGIQHFESSRMLVNADREQAIHQAIDLANPNDLIVIAGKGHEDYQILADCTIHFDDREVVQTYMNQAGHDKGNNVESVGAS